MYTPDIYFRADGDSTRGLGHLYRCMAIAGTFDKEKTCFVSVDFPEQVLPDIEQSFGTITRLINDNNDYGLKHLKSLVKTNNVVVLDGYHFDQTYRCELKKSNCKTVMIDDMFMDFTCADMLLNPSQEAKKDMYSGDGNPKFCFGFQYAPVRKLFSEQHKYCRVSKTAFVAMGGADPKNLTPKIAEKVASTGLFETIHVLTKDKIVSNSAVNIISHQELTAGELKCYFATSALVVLPASTMSMEAMTTGAILALGYFIDNQESLYRSFTQHNLAAKLGDLNHWDKINWIEIITEAFRSSQVILKNQSEVFDGKALTRIKNKIDQIRKI